MHDFGASVAAQELDHSLKDAKTKLQKDQIGYQVWPRSKEKGKGKGKYKAKPSDDWADR